jgi:hypothetical protein
MAVPCVNTHKVSTEAQGPGVCCAALAASGQAPAVGVRLATTDKNGKCFVCEITTSHSPKHAGQLVFKRGKSQGLCPTSTHGCCALLPA